MQIVSFIFAFLILCGSIEAQEVRNLFNGVSLDGWEVVDFPYHGDVTISDSCIIVSKGGLISGIKWVKDFPKINYEVTLDANRVEGYDFFCGMTFPVNESFLTLVLGGWGGSVIGLSNIDGEDANNNDTFGIINFELNQWYSIRLKVTEQKVEAWINGYQIVDFPIENHELSLRSEMKTSTPFGIDTYRTTAAFKNIRYSIIAE